MLDQEIQVGLASTWLPTLDAFRTFCLSPDREGRAIIQGIERLTSFLTSYPPSEGSLGLYERRNIEVPAQQRLAKVPARAVVLAGQIQGNVAGRVGRSAGGKTARRRPATGGRTAE